jgi:DNA polymerase (family 10)
MNKKEIAAILDEMGTLLELKGENPFRSRAYHNAAQVIGTLNDDLGKLISEKTLTSVKGIGSGLSEIIIDLFTAEKSKQYEELRTSIPKGVLEMLRIQGLGPKKVKVLFEKLKIRSIAELKTACTEHKLLKMEGFGEKTEENILKGIEHLEHSSDKYLYPKAKDSADRIVSSLKALKQVKQCEIAGSLRRKKEVIGDIDILVTANEKDRDIISKTFLSHTDVASTIAAGDTKSSVILKSGIHCDLRIVADAEFPFALNYFTGSKEHNVEMRSLARTFGWSLNEYEFSVINDEKGKTKIKKAPVCKTETDIYRALGLSFVPPELRENTGEIEAAQKKRIPNLIDEKDLRGTFHCHTSSSDGVNSLEEMVNAAKQLGWEYLGIADHSQAAAYAGGLKPDRARAQIKAIAKLNEQLKGFRIFAGVECDILPDGSMDYDDSMLSQFDYVVASIHSKFKMTEAEATQRIVKALKNKYVTILGHPTGRLLLEREGYPLNLNEIITVAGDLGKCIEINAHPMRLDLDWRYLKFAKEKGVVIAINPDAHSTEGLRDVQYGVGIARKGWLEAGDVLNTKTAAAVDKYFKEA